MTTGGFDSPTLVDFNRAISQLCHDKLERIQAARLEVTDGFIKAGGLDASRYPETAADRFDHLYREFLIEAADRTVAYVDRLGDPQLLAGYLKPHLEWMRDRTLDQIPEAMNMQVPLQNQYKNKLTQRLEAVLQDLRIGIVNGKAISTSLPEKGKPQEMLQLKPGMWGINIDLKLLWSYLVSRLWPRKR